MTCHAAIEARPAAEGKRGTATRGMAKASCDCSVASRHRRSAPATTERRSLPASLLGEGDPVLVLSMLVFGALHFPLSAKAPFSASRASGERATVLTRDC